MNKLELIDAIAANVNTTISMPKKDVTAVLDAIVEVIQEAVANGEKVQLVGFGTFEAKQRSARTGRNPQTGATIEIPAKKVPSFSAGKKFKDIVNK